MSIGKGTPNLRKIESVRSGSKNEARVKRVHSGIDLPHPE
jgi:hypothetical protein